MRAIVIDLPEQLISVFAEFRIVSRALADATYRPGSISAVGSKPPGTIVSGAEPDPLEWDPISLATSFRFDLVFDAVLRLAIGGSLLVFEPHVSFGRAYGAQPF